MFYKIIDIKTVAETGVLYVLVHFWADKKNAKDGALPKLINDFYIDIHTTREVYVRDADGLIITKSGAKIKESDLKNATSADAPLTKVEPVDVNAFVERTIDRFVERAEARNYVGNLTSPSKFTNTDIRKTKEAALTLIGMEKEKVRNVNV